MHRYTLTILPGVNPHNPVRPLGETFRGLTHGAATSMACAAAIGAGWQGFWTPKAEHGPRTPDAWRLTARTSALAWECSRTGAVVRIEREA